MSAEFDLRLAWLAHREGNLTRRDALLTLAIASSQPESAMWVGTIRDFLVKTHPGHLFDGFYALDEAFGDRRVIAALKRLRLSFPETRVRHLVHRSEVARGRFTGRKTPIITLIHEMLAPPKTAKREKSAPRSLGSTSVATEPAVSPQPEIPTGEPPDSILSFYLNLLLGVAVLCRAVLEENRDDKRAA